MVNFQAQTSDVIEVIDDKDYADNAPMTGTLRWAIEQANQAGKPTTIRFSPKVRQINLNAELPALKNNITLNGQLQNKPSVLLNGVNAGGGTNGLVIEGSGNIVCGLMITGFDANGILITGKEAANNRIAGNYIGTDGMNETKSGNRGSGIRLYRDATRNRIGASAPEEFCPQGNVIAGNRQNGIDLIGINSDDKAKPFIAPSENILAGNWIGLTSDGKETLPNLGYGILLSNGTSKNEISGQNVISSNGRDGISVLVSGNTQIVNNFIGTDVSGTKIISPQGSLFGNAEDGLRLDDNTRGTVIARNVISGNLGNGISLTGQFTDDNKIFGNQIGTDQAREARLGNRKNGIYIATITSNEPKGNRIGPETLTNGDSDRNVILANHMNGISIQRGVDVRVVGNIIRENYQSGIRIDGEVSATRIGIQADTLPNDKARRALEPNIVIANGEDGIVITGDKAQKNQVSGNWIGTTPAGELNVGNNGAGIRISDGAHDNYVAPLRRGGNIILGNKESGILVTSAGTTKNEFYGNFIGTYADFNVALGNGKHGIELSNGAQGNLIGAAALEGVRNTIAGNARDGIYITGRNTSGNSILGNFIGFGESPGSAQLNGIHIAFNANKNKIGAPGDKGGDYHNTISGNQNCGLLLDTGAQDNQIRANYIGVNQAGRGAQPNGKCGIQLSGGATRNQIGGSAPLEQNVISGNGEHGVTIKDAAGNQLLGNLIGLDASGKLRVSNGGHGVYVIGNSPANVIGVENGLNTISGNTLDGIYLSGSGVTKTIIGGNNIGVDPSGNTVNKEIYANRNGIALVDGVQDTLIQGTNVLTGNRADGILLSGVGVTRNTIKGALIGTTRNAPGNAKISSNEGYDGIRIEKGASNNLIGTGKNDPKAPSERNRIIGNRNGILITDPTSVANQIMGNDIQSNTEAGILILESSANVVGGAGYNELFGNLKANIIIDGSSAIRNQIFGNYIGVRSDGSVPDKTSPVPGISVRGGASETEIGRPRPKGGKQSCDVSGGANVIAANKTGILISDSNKNIVIGNCIGLVLSGLTNDPAQGVFTYRGNLENGIFIKDGAANRIGIGSQDESGENYGNLIVGSETTPAGISTNGLLISGQKAIQNRVAGNMFGVAFGVKPGQPTLNACIELRDDASDNHIGAEDRDRIAYNKLRYCRFGIEVRNASRNLISGNEIGTPFEGDKASASLGNLTVGIQIIADGGDSTGNLIGRLRKDGAPANVIVDSPDGIIISGARQTQLANNYIGIMADKKARAIQQNGIRVEKKADCTLIGWIQTDAGGKEQGMGNWIAGNAKQGIWIRGASNTLVSANQIGTLAANGANGILIEPFSDGQTNSPVTGTVIGIVPKSPCDDLMAGKLSTGNKIAGNKENGILVRETSGLNIRGNQIGIAIAAQKDGTLSNARNGIEIADGSTQIEIGGDNETFRNQVVGNGLNGLLLTGYDVTKPGAARVGSLAKITIQNNQIEENGALANLANNTDLSGSGILNFVTERGNREILPKGAVVIRQNRIARNKKYGIHNKGSSPAVFGNLIQDNDKSGIYNEPDFGTNGETATAADDLIAQPTIGGSAEPDKNTFQGNCRSLLPTAPSPTIKRTPTPLPTNQSAAMVIPECAEMTSFDTRPDNFARLPQENTFTAGSTIDWVQQKWLVAFVFTQGTPYPVPAGVNKSVVLPKSISAKLSTAKTSTPIVPDLTPTTCDLARLSKVGPNAGEKLLYGRAGMRCEDVTTWQPILQSRIDGMGTLSEYQITIPNGGQSCIINGQKDVDETEGVDGLSVGGLFRYQVLRSAAPAVSLKLDTTYTLEFGSSATCVTVDSENIVKVYILDQFNGIVKDSGLTISLKASDGRLVDVIMLPPDTQGEGIVAFKIIGKATGTISLTASADGFGATVTSHSINVKTNGCATPTPVPPG